MVGSRITHYKITDKLGEGGMGVVYLAEDTRLDRRVALKFLPPRATARKEDRDRFEQEARAAARLNHPNICTIHALDEHDGQLFLVMEYVKGTTLRERIDQGQIPIDEVRDFAVQICEGLAEAHTAGVLHRDIKPSNLMVDQKGRVKVMDFGLAKLRDGEGEHLTDASSTVGTKAYMSPEQIQGKAVDHRTDIFALGVVLYELLTGTHPFAAEYAHAVAYKLVNEDPLPPSTLRQEIDLRLDHIVSRCLAKDQEDRYDDAAAIASALQGGVKGVFAASSTKLRPSDLFGGAFFDRHSTTVGGVAIVTGLLVLGLLLFPGLFGSQEDEPIPNEKHLVVLPFTNLSEEAIPNSLKDGIMEVLTSKITQLEHHEGSLWVVPSSDVRDQQVTSVSEASRVFGTNLAVTGSVQRDDDRFRLTINLVDGSTVRQLRSSVLELDWTELSAIQDELATALASMLEVELSPSVAQRLRAGSSESSSAYVLYTEGRGYLSRFEALANVEEAIERFGRAIEADRDYARAQAALGEAYWRKYDLTREREWTDKALAHAEKAIELDNQLAEAYITMAFIYNGMSRYDEAREVLDRLDEPANTSSTALTERARAYEGLGHEDRAEETHKKAVESKRTYWGSHSALGAFYYRQGRYEEAAAAFRNVVELTPDNIRAYNNLGGSYFMQNMYGEAREAFEASLNIQPNYVALSNLGTLEYHEGRFGRAIELFEEALDYHASDYLVWGNLGSAYYWTGDHSERMYEALNQAIELAEEARQVSPGDPQLVVQLAGYYAHLSNEARARTLLTQAASMNALDMDSMVSVSHIYEQLGNRPTALHWLEEALEKGYRLETMEHLPGMEGFLNDPRLHELREKYEYELPQPELANQ